MTTIKFHSWHNNQSTFNRRRRVYEILLEYRVCKSAVNDQQQEIKQKKKHTPTTTIFKHQHVQVLDQ